MPHRRRALTALVAVAVAGGALIAACSGATGTSSTASMGSTTFVLNVDTSQLGDKFEQGAVGLSTEAAELNRDRLTAKHDRLVRLMRLLGPSVLRIGGGTVDRSWWTSKSEPPPSWATSVVTPNDFDTLRGLLAATGWKVLLGVDFGHLEPARVADEVRYAHKIFGDSLVGIELGNEPNSYLTPPNNVRVAPYGVNEYLRDVETYRRTIAAAAPGLTIHGPSLSDPAWLTQMGSRARVFAELTQHYYPIHQLDTCPTVIRTAPEPTASELLSPVVRQQEDSLLRTLVSVGNIADRPTRIGETNSVSCRPNVYANPGFAGALWSLDWSLRAASIGVRGINFHGGPYPCILYPESPICVPGDGAAAKAGDIRAQPEYYGLLAARQLEGGRFAPTHLVGPHSLPNITTWATVAPNGTIKIAIDNLAVAGATRTVFVSSAGYSVTEQALAGSSPDSSTGISLGGAIVSASGKWQPRPGRRLRGHGAVRVSIRAASAVILTLGPTTRSHVGE